MLEYDVLISEYENQLSYVYSLLTTYETCDELFNEVCILKEEISNLKNEKKLSQNENNLVW